MKVMLDEMITDRAWAFDTARHIAVKMFDDLTMIMTNRRILMILNLNFDPDSTLLRYRY